MAEPMPEQEKPLEPGFYFVRYVDREKWEPAELTISSDVGECFVMLIGATGWLEAELFEIGPRLHPPQESANKQKGREG